MKLKVRKLGSFRGLMFRRKPKVPVLITLNGQGIHTWFVFYPIDCVFLDVNGIALEKKFRIRPFSTYTPRRPASFVVEFPSDNSIVQNISVGKRLDLEVVDL